MPEEKDFLKKSKGELKKRLEKYKGYLETIPDIIYELDVEGKFVFVNSAIEELGYKPEELIGEHFKKIIHPEDFRQVSRSFVLPKYKNKITGDKDSPKLFDERRTGERMTKNLVVRLELKSFAESLSNYCYGELHSSGEWREDSENEKSFFGSIGIIRDITERKRLEQMKDEFVNTVSHEIRTPLTSIKEGVSQVLSGVLGEVNDEQKEFLSMCLEDINRLKRIIDNLLDISNIKLGKIKLWKEKCDVLKLVKEVTSLFKVQAKEKGVELKKSLPSGTLKAYIDKDKVFQIFSNLLNNAFKFTEKGYIEVSVEEKEEMIECKVTDTGVGIKEENIPKIFNRFQQFGRPTKPGEKGTGLGLAIVKNIVELHGGDIWVDSQLNKGTSLYFTLPKYTPIELFKENVEKYFEKAKIADTFFSILVYGIKDYEDIKRRVKGNKLSSLLQSFKKVIGENLYRRQDKVLQLGTNIIVLLPTTNKSEAEAVNERLIEFLNGCLSREGVGSNIKLSKKIVNFPEDAKTVKGILNKCEVKK